MGLMFSRETKAIIECLLFVSKDPLTLRALAQVLDIPEADVKILADELMEEYDNERHGINITFVANGYQMCTRPELAGYIEKLYKPQGAHGLSKAALETLAIVAYKQPITRAEIEAIRGVKVDSAIGTLVEKTLVKEVGRKDGPGRPMLFGTTSNFLRYFGLQNLAELPDLTEFTQRHGDIEQEEIEDLSHKEGE